MSNFIEHSFSDDYNQIQISTTTKKSTSFDESHKFVRLSIQQPTDGTHTQIVPFGTNSPFSMNVISINGLRFVYEWYRFH